MGESRDDSAVHAAAVERTARVGIADRVSLRARRCRDSDVHWCTLERWLATNSSDRDASEIRMRHEREKRTYLRHGRELLGWAIFVGWKPAAS
jgi:hypothetical protein